MREEESPLHVVRVSVGVAVLVMNSMITRPDVNTILSGNRLSDGEKNSQRKLCFVRSVCPKSVSAASNSKSVPEEQEEICT